MRMIDADELIDFPYSEGAGTEEQIMDWIEECGLSDEEDKAKMLCWKVIEGFRNVVKTAPTILASQWISVEDRLPGENGQYIVTACDEGESYDEMIWNDTVVVCAEYYNGAWTWQENGTEYDLNGIVTHWMPLPTNPKDGGE